MNLELLYNLVQFKTQRLKRAS